MLCAAGSALTVSRGIGEGKVSGTKEGVAVVTSLVGRAAVPWLDVERMPVLTGDETAKGSVVPCIGSAEAPSEIRSLSRRLR